MSEALTQKYVEAFGSKDIEAVAALFADDFALEDPVVKRIEGKANVVEVVRGIFDDNPGKFEFTAKNVYVSGDTTIIEFALALEAVTLEGVDIIEWRSDQMVELRAYLDVPK